METRARVPGCRHDSESVRLASQPGARVTFANRCPGPGVDGPDNWTALGGIGGGDGFRTHRPLRAWSGLGRRGLLNAPSKAPLHTRVRAGHRALHVSSSESCLRPSRWWAAAFRPGRRGRCLGAGTARPQGACCQEWTRRLLGAGVRAATSCSSWGTEIRTSWESAGAHCGGRGPGPGCLARRPESPIQEAAPGPGHALRAPA